MREAPARYITDTYEESLGLQDSRSDMHQGREAYVRCKHQEFTLWTPKSGVDRSTKERSLVGQVDSETYLPSLMNGESHSLCTFSSHSFCTGVSTPAIF